MVDTGATWVAPSSDVAEAQGSTIWAFLTDPWFVAASDLLVAFSGGSMTSRLPTTPQPVDVFDASAKSHQDVFRAHLAEWLTAIATDDRVPDRLARDAGAIVAWHQDGLSGIYVRIPAVETAARLGFSTRTLLHRLKDLRELGYLLKADSSAPGRHAAYALTIPNRQTEEV